MENKKAHFDCQNELILQRFQYKSDGQRQLSPDDKVLNICL